MRKVFGIITILLAVLSLSVFMSGGAEAASNGNHDQGFTCTTTNASGASTTITSVFSYHTTGIGTSAENRLYPDRLAWHTTPAAQLDSMEIALDQDNSGSGYLGMLRQSDGGWGNAIANDVASSGSFTTFRVNYLAFDNGTPGSLGLFIDGGVGSSGGHCQVGHDSLSVSYTHLTLPTM
jgi:hypothetical protein